MPEENFYRTHLANLWYCLCLSTTLLFPRGLKCAATAYMPTFPGQMLSSVSPPSLHKALCPLCPPPCLTYALVCTLHWLFVCLCFCVSAMWKMCVHIEFSILSLPSTKLFVHFVHHPPLTSHHIYVYMTALIHASISRAQMRKEAFIIKCPQRCSASCFSSMWCTSYIHNCQYKWEKKLIGYMLEYLGTTFFWALNKGLCQKYKMHETWSNAISGAHFNIFFLNNGHYPNLLKPQNIAMIN